VQKAIRTRQEVTDEIEFVYPDGTVRHIYGKAVPLYGPGGVVRGAIGGFAEITAIKQSEREREQLLQSERVAREEAEQANRLKDQFLAVLSHELRSPLNPILGWAKLLQTRSFDSAKTAHALATIERNAQLQAQLVDDLLDLARILRGKLHLTPISLNVANVVQAALETVKATATAKSIALHLNLDQTIRVAGDAARLQQIVGNLLSNAVKFTPERGQIIVALRSVDDQAEIGVTDTGIGISQDFLPYLFESFRQEDISITRKHGGLGLGLAIVRQLVEIHGGTITAHSPGEGQGATFIVRLPQLAVEAPVNPVAALPPSVVDLAGPAGVGRRRLGGYAGVFDGAAGAVRSQCSHRWLCRRSPRPTQVAVAPRADQRHWHARCRWLQPDSANSHSAL
jgi:signal transduction histidine kinase